MHPEQRLNPRGRRGPAAEQGGRHAQGWEDPIGLGIASDPSGEGPSAASAPGGPPPDSDEADEAGRRVLELRIHGVANTPPEGTLGVKQVRRVDGDEHTGFYRPIKQYAPGPVVTEAYSWGSLTSASRSLNQDGTSVGVRKDLQRALWMLLLPFAFANVAFWTRLRTAGPGEEEHWGRGRGETAGPRRSGRVVPAVALPGGDRDVRARRGRRRCRSGGMAVRDPAVPEQASVPRLS